MVQGDSPEAREQNRRVELVLELEGKPGPVHKQDKAKLQPNFDHDPKAVEK